MIVLEFIDSLTYNEVGLTDNTLSFRWLSCVRHSL